MKIISGKTGTPHVTSAQFRQIIEGIIGQESYILKSGENMEPELASNNMLKIRGGVMSHHGNVSGVDLNTYDEVTIKNGSQGMKRIDLIVNRYTRSDETGIEKNEWVVLTGTPDQSSPKVPGHIVGNLQNGDLTDDCPVFKVHLEGIQVTKVEKLLPVLEGDLASLNQKGAKVLSKDDFGIVIDTGHSHVRFGTATRPTARDGSGNRYIKLWSANEIATLLKVPQINVHFFDLSIRNGDGTANPMHFYAPEYWNDGNFYVYTWLGNDGSVRVSYRMEYPTIDI